MRLWRARRAKGATSLVATLPAAASPAGVVDPDYYTQGERWEHSVYRTVRWSRNSWRLIAIVLGLADIAAIGLLYELVPLKGMEVVTLLVDKTSGYVEVANPLQRGALSQSEAVTRANVVRFLRARETYDPRALKDNFDLASLFSTGAAAGDLQAQWAASNPQNPMKLWGKETTISVIVKSVIFLNDHTAAVRFETDRKTDHDMTVDHWVANVRFRYSGEPMRNDWRFDNPLGFQVVEYRRDQETVRSGEATE
ncbi:type IV secretion system protein VirB8 [Rhizobiales bacterium GAS188]|nr:type IV secretion system protein VirB8 [Rhizobiales bacterium GAS188]